MRTLDQIVAAVRQGQEVTERELRYAVVAFDVLLANVNLHEDVESLREYFLAAESAPDRYVGPNNDPESKEAQEWHRTMHEVGDAYLRKVRGG